MHHVCYIMLVQHFSRKVGALQMSIIIIIRRTTITTQCILKLKRSWSTVLHRPLRDIWVRVTLTRVGRAAARTHCYRCVQYCRVSKQWCGCQCSGLLTCTQMVMHAIAHGGCTDTVRESALKADSGRNIPCRTGGLSIAPGSSVGRCTN